ncbi:fibronectin type III domain-containing protein [Neobacillus sp. 19]|uniref:fibronectin type III domain-containing protein n=1 Tax=Neobacillus sp. 19 TaxID=3394458 RepID=UPI003BF7451E
MRQKFYCMSFFIILFICLLGQPFKMAYASGKGDTEESPVLQFPVMSDIHIGEKYQKDRFIKALSDFRILAPNYQAIAMVGDITNHGWEQEYDDFNNILNSNIIPSAEKIITMGNHEYFEGVFSNRDWDPEFYMNRFVSKTRLPEEGTKIYYDKWIQGYHFITLGGEGFPSSDDHDHANVTDEQYDWLEKTLSEDSDPAKPIFVFLHQAIDNTVYGSDDWGGGFNNNRLQEILSQYPQVILFSGHSHYLLNHPRTVYQNGFTMANAGSVAYTYSDSGSHLNSQGLLVNVFLDKVEIKARDFTTNTWVRTFTVQLPFKQTYYDKNNPFFFKGASTKVEKNVTGDTVTLSWDAAFDDSQVDKYIIKNNGKVLYTKYMNFWDNKSQESNIYATLTNLSPDTVYNLSIIAVDAWNKESINSLTVSFKTSKLSGWKIEEGKWRFYKNNTKVTGWQEIEGKWYLFHSDTSMITGWYTNGAKKYYLNENGAMQIGWKKLNDEYYYFGSDGDLKIGWLQLGDKWYFLDNNGAMKTGWLQVGGKWYYLDDNGEMKNGWLKVSNKWYYLDGDGEMKTGWISLNGKWYYLLESGEMKIGWLLSGNKWYYLQSSGEMLTGWLYDKGKWYYLNANGSMAQNTIIQGYVIGSEGVWRN